MQEWNEDIRCSFCVFAAAYYYSGFKKKKCIWRWSRKQPIIIFWPVHCMNIGNVPLSDWAVTQLGSGFGINSKTHNILLAGDIFCFHTEAAVKRAITPKGMVLEIHLYLQPPPPTSFQILKTPFLSFNADHCEDVRRRQKKREEKKIT